MSRWQLGAAAPSSDPLSPWCGEPALYELAAVGRPPLMLHPSRVVRFLGNPLPDPWAAATPWSDSVLQALYDAVHAPIRRSRRVPRDGAHLLQVAARAADMGTHP